MTGGAPASPQLQVVQVEVADPDETVYCFGGSCGHGASLSETFNCTIAKEGAMVDRPDCFPYTSQGDTQLRQFKARVVARSPAPQQEAIRIIRQMLTGVLS